MRTQGAARAVDISLVLTVQATWAHAGRAQIPSYMNGLYTVDTDRTSPSDVTTATPHVSARTRHILPATYTPAWLRTLRLYVSPSLTRFEFALKGQCSKTSAEAGILTDQPDPTEHR